MPSRWLCLLIVAFWLAATGLLYVRELAPSLREHDPPPYVIDLTAETQVVHPRVVWIVLQNGQVSYVAKTWMDHNEEDDSFSLFADIKPALPPLLDKSVVPDSLLLQHFVSSYRVSREGRLLELEVSGELSHRPVPGLPELGFRPEFKLTGRVVDGGMLARLQLPQFKGIVREADSTFRFPVSQNGTIFLPLHPVHKIKGVRPGASWRVPEIDPLSDAAKAWLRRFAIDLPGGGERFLNARVRERPEAFPYDMGDEQQHVCWVIDYRDADDPEKLTAATWVEVDTDLVLCQEAKSEQAGSLRVVRESARSKITR
jgi:hypothetical protein